jgi:hypothetical protein
MNISLLDLLFETWVFFYQQIFEVHDMLEPTTQHMKYYYFLY